jgi:hypothetical protein
MPLTSDRPEGDKQFMLKFFRCIILLCIVPLAQGQAQEQGIVVNCTTRLNIRSAPSNSGSVVGKMSCQEGSKVRILGMQGNYYLIEQEGHFNKRQREKTLRFHPVSVKYCGARRLIRNKVIANKE